MVSTGMGGRPASLSNRMREPCEFSFTETQAHLTEEVFRRCVEWLREPLFHRRVQHRPACSTSRLRREEHACGEHWRT